MDNLLITITYFMALGTVAFIFYGVGQQNGYEKGKSEGWRQCDLARMKKEK